MAEIHILPTGRDAASLSRSYEALRQRFEAGDDLGDRRHHIRMLQASLEASHRSLWHEIEALRALPPMPGLDMEALPRSLDALTGLMASALATCAIVINAQCSDQRPSSEAPARSRPSM